ncbi:hypothetical protein [Methylobacterium sp. ARG-1]|uniref:hypothetical protein n=1 Tax=Methylobacterium sp. ARG-1 TaxID=1692501 RepID=UPI0006812F46|nr:hypothetical protein [Methylobacterium sp. ARG-1]KNY21764.1 hypothetical protein AKJ13_16175 [Methylobacterium sp. ARG-1]
MPVERDQMLSGDALDRLACRLLAEVRSQYPQKPLSKPICELGDDVGTNLLAWLFDTNDDALTDDGGD